MKLLPVFAAVAMCGVVVASCGEAPRPPVAAPSLVDQTAYAGQVRANVDKFSWPSDYRPDIDQLLRDSGPEPDEFFGSDDARLTLSVVNICAWFLSWDAARRRGDTAAIAAILRTIDAERDRLLSAMDQAGHDFVKQAMERVHANDPGPAEQYTTANCDRTVWVGH